MTRKLTPTTKRHRKPRPQTAAPSAPPPDLVRPPPPGHGKRGEDGYLGYLLRQAQGVARLSLERGLGQVGVTPPQFMVLTMLKAYPGLSGADLARVALLTPQTVGVIIRNLERDGAIRRTPHPVHGRVLQWTLTTHGLALLQQCRRHALALERRLGRRYERDGTCDHPSLVGQNCRRFAGHVGLVLDSPAAVPLSG